MSKPCVNCGGKFMWLQRQVITSDNDLHRIAVDVFRCQGCGYLFIVDKESKNPNRTKRFGTFNSKGYTPNEPKKTYDEEINIIFASIFFQPQSLHFAENFSHIYLNFVHHWSSRFQS